ncbi:dihydrolipoyl dehydrogenase [Gudongella oleilytica]|uniref:dihydrolipoyl dehydrogenase n=1 Tax=Gudongella oleilytica TaxID=1582259 RepID=UPI002A36DA90|nr:dihydrolipoyl dehydrogenase [Gudongella oleilytica]MDY0256369.1 dihydrolipoyl dehydrogenase [Gudongella oleilytica]
MTKRIAIIGAGPGGYVAAIRAAQLEAQVYLIENREIGGTCLNRGCIPTKTYFRNAQILSDLRNSHEFGIKVEGFSLDGKALLERKNKVVNDLVSGIERLIGSYQNIELIQGKASFKDKNTLNVQLNGGGSREVEADNIIIATGSFPQMTETKGIDLPGVITSDDLLELDHVPETLIVVGGGVIGLEFASIYKELGSHVILLASRILKDGDKEIAKRLTPMLKKQGIETYVDIRAKEITKDGECLKVVARYKEKDEEIEVIGDYVLIASGRAPLVEGLNLEGIGVEFSGRGIKVNDSYETTVPGIYAIGDVNSKGIQLAHVASSQGEYVVETIMGHKPDLNLEHWPACVFTMTEVAQVGFTEEQLKEKGIDYRSSKFMFSANGKALSLGETDGIVKILASNEDNRILGVHIIGPHANDLIHEGALAISNNMDVSAIKRTIHAHPTLSEAFFEAALGLDEAAIHIAPKKKRRG